MDFRLKVFHSVARNLSFTKAARELFISQPAVSKNIRELEMQYKVALFERNGPHIRLTEAGKWLLQHVELIREAYDCLEKNMNSFAGYSAGEILLGASTTIAQYVLPPVLSAFIRKYPNIKLSLLNGNSSDIEQALRDGRISLGFVEGNARQKDLRYMHFLDDELVAVVRSGSPLAQCDEIEPDALRQIPVVLRENGSGTLDVLEESLKHCGIKLSDLKILMQLGSTESIKRFLETADALGFVSIRAVDRELKVGQLKVIEIDGFEAKRTFSFVMKQGMYGDLEELFVRFSEMERCRL